MSVNNNSIDKFLSNVKDQLQKFSETDNITLSIILELINKNLAQRLYDDIPNDINTIISQKDYSASIDHVKKLLLSYGISKELVEKVNASILVKILKSLKYFINDKSTYSMFKIFQYITGENLYLAELYLTYNPKTNDVYFIPKWINEPPESIKNSVTYIDYDTIYKSVPELLITKNEWLQQFQQSNISYPILTNILYIYTVSEYNISIINELISRVFYKEHINDQLTILIDNKIFKIKMGDIIHLYYYIVALFLGINTLSTSKLSIINTRFDINTINITTKDLDNLVNLADNTKSYHTSQKLKQYINKHFPISHLYQSKTYTIDDLQSYLYSNYPELINYLNSKYNNTQQQYKLTTMISLITNLINSIQYKYLNNKWADIFIKNYFFITLYDIDKSMTKLLINLYKPINVLLTEKVVDYILLTIFDPLDNLFIESYVNSFQFDKFNVDHLNLLREQLNLLITYLTNIRYDFSDISKLSINIARNNLLNFNSKSKSELTKEIVNYFNLLREYINIHLLQQLHFRYSFHDIPTIIQIITKHEIIKIKSKIKSMNLYQTFKNDSKIQDLLTNTVINVTNPRYIINDIFFVSKY